MEIAAGSSATVLDESKPDDKPKKHFIGTFKCEFCNLEEVYNYKGMKPPFAKDLMFKEDCYIMKDPFSLINKGQVLVLGSNCSICNKTVCLSCSIFYMKRFCQECATLNFQNMPLQLQSKIKLFHKQLDGDI